jgi:hypothetical protein
MQPLQSIIAIVPSNDLNASEAFYHRLGFLRRGKDMEGPDDYRILYDAEGQSLHLRQAEAGWLVPGRNPFGLYIALERVDELAAEFAGEMVGAVWPEDKAWGMYEFAVTDPDQTLVRIGWPSRLREAPAVG